MGSIDERAVEDVRLGGERTPKTVDMRAAILGGVVGALVVMAIWLTSVPVQALFFEGLFAGLVAGSVNENSKVPAIDGAAATILGAALGLVGICTWLVVNLSLSTGLEVSLFLSLFGPGMGLIIFTAPLAAVPGAIAEIGRAHV